MVKPLKICMICCLGLMPLFSLAQETRKDTSETKLTRLYKFAVKRKLTYWLYQSVFVEPAKGNHEVPLKKKSKPEADPLLTNKGKVIRYIYIFALDPYGTNINDTTVNEENFFKKAANALHVTSRKATINEQLLFQEGDRLDPLEIQESERLLRQSEYIWDAKIKVKPIPGKKDTIDMLVIVKDRWSLTGDAAFNSANSMVRLRERNFLGLGHQLENTFNYNYHPEAESKFNLNGNYTVPFIRQNYFATTIYYGTSVNNSYQGVSVNRPFYSLLTRWAGGINLIRNNSYSYYQQDSVTVRLPLQSYQQDVWIGKSFRIGSGNNEASRSSSIILASRVVNTDYVRRPSFELDSLHSNQNNTLFLGTIGFSARRYYQDKKIFRFGGVEDVPEGRLLAFTGGVHKKEFGTEYYTAVRIGAGNHLPELGYFSLQSEYGTYLNDRRPERGVFNANLAYFSDLVNLDKWNFRQFVNIHYVEGIRRKPYEYITIQSSDGLYGFRSDVLRGTTRLTLNLESIVYTPLNIVGFKFATILFAGFGMLSTEQNELLNSKVFQAYGLGFLIRNEHLVINTLQFSFGIYPEVPGTEGLQYRFNTLRSYNLRFRDFDVSRPDLVGYN